MMLQKIIFGLLKLPCRFWLKELSYHLHGNELLGNYSENFLHETLLTMHSWQILPRCLECTMLSSR